MRTKLEKLLQESPGLKAKDIAKKLDCQKSEVNAFLHQHKNIFEQDENFCWSLKTTSELRVTFRSNQWICSDLFEEDLKSAGSPLDSKCASIVFVIPEKCRFLLAAAARLLALCNQLVSCDKKVTIDFTAYPSTLTYLDRAGFLSHLNSKIIILPQIPSVSRSKLYKGNSDAMVEFGQVVLGDSPANKELINQLTDCFVKQSNNKYETVAYTIFAELIGNISEHSQSSLCGFAALQKYQPKNGKKHIQTVVSDSGVGIANTLRPSLEEHYPHLHKKFSNKSLDSDVELVVAVLSKGEISRYGSGRGLGFKSSREQAQKFEVKLSIRQENFSLTLIYKNGRLIDTQQKLDLPRIMGTHVCFDFFVDDQEQTRLN